MLTFKQFLLEAWGRDTAKAIKMHYKLERKSGNQLMHPAVLGALTGTAGAGIGSAVSRGDFKTAGVLAAMHAPGLAPHVKDVIKLRKGIKAQKKRERGRAVAEQNVGDNNDTNPMDVKRAYYKLKAKKTLDVFEKRKLKILADHPDIKNHK